MGGLFNPVQNVRRPNPPPRNRRLFPDELERILASTESGSLGDVIFLAIETGMRRGEFARMRREHIDFKKKVLLIPDTKTQTPRSIGLDEELVLMLKNIPRRLDGKVWGYDDKGLGITRVFQEACKRVRKSYEKECEEKGIETDPNYLKNLRLHDQRHEATSRLFELGLKTEEVMKTTGHKTYSMLARYTHLKPENIGEKITRLKRMKKESFQKSQEET